MTTGNETIENNIELEIIPSEDIDAESDTARYKINTYGADYTLEILSKKIDDKEIIIPSFQRRYVWSIKKASKLIESFLLGLPVPQIFLYREEDTQDLLVVDWQQRLKTINFFFKGVFDSSVVFKLTGVWAEWEGKTFNDLSLVDKRKLNNYILRSNIFEQTDPQDKSSIFEIFERLNTGGMALNTQEVRNCVIRGDINDFLQELNNYSNWRTILNKLQPDARMKDIEMLLRFFALYEKRDQYKKPMKDFITNFMTERKNIDENTKKRYRDIFFKTIDLLINNIWERPFRIKGGINIAVYDSVMIAVTTLEPKDIPNLKTNYDKLIKEPQYKENTSEWTTNNERVKSRIDIAINYLKTWNL